jgi:hypothetical protein
MNRDSQSSAGIVIAVSLLLLLLMAAGLGAGYWYLMREQVAFRGRSGATRSSLQVSHGDVTPDSGDRDEPKVSP